MTKRRQKYLFTEELCIQPIYSCIHCRAHLACQKDLISKSFQGSQGRAYLFCSVVNVGSLIAEERLLLTGLHYVADIYCYCCSSILGWKYEKAFELNQRYKEGKFIVEVANLIKDNCWDYDSKCGKSKRHSSHLLFNLDWSSDSLSKASYKLNDLNLNSTQPTDTKSQKSQSIKGFSATVTFIRDLQQIFGRASSRNIPSKAISFVNNCQDHIPTPLEPTIVDNVSQSTLSISIERIQSNVIPAETSYLRMNSDESYFDDARNLSQSVNNNQGVKPNASLSDVELMRLSSTNDSSLNTSGNSSNFLLLSYHNPLVVTECESQSQPESQNQIFVNQLVLDKISQNRQSSESLSIHSLHLTSNSHRASCKSKSIKHGSKNKCSTSHQHRHVINSVKHSSNVVLPHEN